jgi:hypothetical protein
MAFRHELDHEHEFATGSDVVREPFRIGQVLALAIGIFFVVIGAVGMARAGLDSLTSPQVEVAGVGMTPLLAMLHLFVGVIALGGAAGRAASRSVLMGFGPLMIAAGIVALIQVVAAFGWNSVNGVAYLVGGGTAIIAAMLTPVATVEERHVVVG